MLSGMVNRFAATARVQDANSAAFWAYHTARLTFFIGQVGWCSFWKGADVCVRWGEVGGGGRGEVCEVRPCVVWSFKPGAPCQSGTRPVYAIVASGTHQMQVHVRSHVC